MRTQVVLITAGFPYGSSETFLETEIQYLARHFEHVTLVCPHPDTLECRTIPQNCSVVTVPLHLSRWDKLRSLLGIFDPLFIREMLWVRKKYGQTISRGIVKTALVSRFQAVRLMRFLNREVLSSIEPDHTVCYSYWCDDSAVALALLQQKHPTLRTVSRAHGWDVYFQVHELKYLPYRNVIQSSITAIFPISKKGIQEITSSWNTPSTNVYLSRLGVSGRSERTKPSSHHLVVVSCSNIIPLKRVDLLAETILSFTEPITWIHFGDGSERERLEKLAKSKSSPNHNIQFRGKVSNHNVLHFYEVNEVSVFVNTSTSEGIPVSIMEAMSFGIPVVATNVGGTSEIVNNQNGVLLSENPTTYEIKAAIEEVLAHPEKGEAAYETWNERYNAEKNYSEFVNQLKSI